MAKKYLILIVTLIFVSVYDYQTPLSGGPNGNKYLNFLGNPEVWLSMNLYRSICNELHYITFCLYRFVSFCPHQDFFLLKISPLTQLEGMAWFLDSREVASLLNNPLPL